MRLRILFNVAAIALLLVVAAGAEEPKKLSLDLYLEFEQVADPQISPDGAQIVYTRRWVDKINDRWESALWVMNADGSKNRFLTKGSSPRWSPDGTRIAYLADGEPKGTQVFVRWIDAEGATSQVTRVEKAPSGLAWSPDGNSIAFLMLVPKKDTWNIKLPARPEGAKWTENPRIIERLVYRRDRIGFLEEGYRHVFVVPATGGTPRQVTTGDYDYGGGFGGATPAWTPDGREILVSSLRKDDWEYEWRESEIYAVNVETKAVRQLTTRKGPDSNPVVSPNGKWVAYTGYDWTDDTYITSKLYVMGIDGSNPRLLAGDFDRSPDDLEWAADSSGVYFQAEDRGTQNLHFAPLRGTLKQVTQGTHILNVTDINKGGLAVGTRSSPQRPADVVTFNVAKPAEMKQLTAVNDDILGDVKLGEVEEIWYTSVDDYRIQGWIIKPPDFDPKKKYPLVLTIHGGPHAMYGVGFNYGWQVHAASGYVVLYTNPRGSSGYGSAFGNAIKNAYPGKDYDDLMKGVDEVIAKGYVDAQNMFVYGCSGGGVLTAWIVGHTDRFAAASSNCPVINWLSFVGTTDGASWYRNFAKLPWEDPSEHLKRSPLMYVGNVKTPTMLMTGELDLRTPISQTEEFYEALKVRKVPTAMLRFNGEYHGTTSRPSNFLRTFLYLHSWFDKWSRKDKGSPVAEATPERAH
ncbi:MAG TPA: S9 family peptidase [Candidatus Xenobia bacterium]|nr:S9 family peptidase [Candidatus Xenobia bacterium]